MTTNASSSTMSQLLRKATSQLEVAGIATARLDALVLLEDATRRDRSWLLAHPDEHFDGKTLKRFNAWIEKRAQHQPLAYVRGKTEFYGRPFVVNSHTLEPRPETEDMIDLLKKYWQPDWSMADVGTGSGAIGITAALELNTTKIDLIDIDEWALKIARQNVAKHGLSLTCLNGDLLANAPAYDVILANLPYVPDNHTINDAARQEPPQAIFGGPDGLDLYRRLFEQTGAQLVFTEALPFQHEVLEGIAKKAGYQQIDNEGFIQVFSKTIAPAASL